MQNGEPSRACVISIRYSGYAINLSSCPCVRRMAMLSASCQGLPYWRHLSMRALMSAPLCSCCPARTACSAVLQGSSAPAQGLPEQTTLSAHCGPCQKGHLPRSCCSSCLKRTCRCCASCTGACSLRCLIWLRRAASTHRRRRLHS